MKSKLIQIIKLRPLVVLLGLLATLIGCQDEDARYFSTDLGINSSVVRVADSAGITRILIYADNSWSASFEDENTTWAKVETPSGSGHGEFFVSFESNKDQLPRAAKIVVRGGNKTDTIRFQQKGLTPTINISDNELAGIAGGGKMKSGIICNIPFDLVAQEITYGEGSSDWINEIEMENNSLKFKLVKTTESVMREAKLKLSYTDAFGIVTRDSILIKQNPKSDNGSDDAVAKTFEFVKNSLAEGTITDNIYIEGIIVSDKGNPNLATNLNKTYSTIDPTENQVTVYIQDPEGISGGILLKTKNGSDNIFDRYNNVKIWLKGATLTKYSDPQRCVIEGIESMHILEKNEGPAIQPKELYMKDLTDNDIYTYVKLKDVEIAVSNGSFSNINEGYKARMSVYPTCIRDINGNSMYMLTNLDVPYRRDGNRAPQGSGNISGIIVHDNLPRYGGDIGRYSIRHLTREEIDLAEDRNNGFSNVAVEWSRYKLGEDDPLAPDFGAERGAKLSHSRSAIGAGPDFNGLLLTSAADNNGGFSAAGWWYDNKGESWIFEFSTIDITKTLSIQLEGDVIYAGPRNHVIEWAESNDESTTWNYVAEYTWQDLVRAGTGTLLTQVAGHKVVNFNLPDDLLNKQKVYIRSRVKNNEAGTTTSDKGGTIVNTAACRLGHISFKYNK